MDEAKILEDLPEPLRQEVVASIIGKIVSGVPFFRHCEREAMRKLYATLVPIVFMPGANTLVVTSLHFCYNRFYSLTISSFLL